MWQQLMQMGETPFPSGVVGGAERLKMHVCTVPRESKKAGHSTLVDNFTRC